MVNMDTLVTVLIIVSIVFITLCGYVIIQLSSLLKLRIKTTHLNIAHVAQQEADKFIHEMVKIAVVRTNRKYVNPLKDKGEFYEKNHIIAFSQTWQFIMSNTNPLMLEYCKGSVKNTEKWLTDLIEYTVYTLKSETV